MGIEVAEVFDTRDLDGDATRSSPAGSLEGLR